ncbi:putative type VI secretion system effector [Pseudoduganella sp. R-34]|uniref:putative type VI secretion system effector n=1 Tax=Pseudoduganella sp. R-34 TaxID=3404062 RepID=UPI003CEF096B
MTQLTHSQSATYNGETLFLVEGTLSELQIARTTINLLAQIEKDSQAKNLVSGVAGVVGGMHGMVANSAALALYDGEDMYNFAAVLGEHIVCGTLEHADQFKNGEPVKAVVSQRGDVLYVHAIMQAKTQQFYMPLSVFAGRRALFKSCMREASRSAMAASIFFLVIFYFMGVYNEENNNINRMKQLLLTSVVIAGNFLLCFIMEIWTYRTFRYAGFYATAIFELLGFPQPNNIDLIKVGSMNYENTGWKKAWQADLLLQKLGANRQP